ncbi:MAG TPA: PTS transporter subunit IIC [Anaerolineaceae bacterium]|jgi:PTS system galactitol-specific IIC component|nr:PTS transporter subunit IIC [Anaerolineaceae bacterium]
MEILKNIYDYVINAGAFVFVPIIIFLFGLIVGLKVTKAFRASLFVGMGLAGIDLAIWSLLYPTFSTPASMMIERFGIKNLEYIDVGWGLPAAIGWSTPLVPIVVGVIFLLNILLIVLNLTKTLDIDFWNYWHMTLMAAYVYFITDNVVISVILAAIYFIILLKAADFFAPMVQKYWGYPGVSIPHGEVISMGIIQYPVNWILDKIPFLKNLKADQESIRKRFGIFGEIPVMGFLIGVLLAILGGMAIKDIILTGVKVGLGFYLMPKMVSILVEGLLPVSEGARDFVTKKFKNREIYLGLDAAVLMGDSSVLATGLLLLPYFILISTVLPGNGVLPIGTLDATIWYVAIAVGLANGNIIKAFINGLITLPIILWVSTAMAPLLTKVAIAIQYQMPDLTSGALGVTGVTTGAEWPAWLLTLIAKIFAQ